MSQENVELLKRLYDDFNRGGAEAALPYLDPNVDFYQPDEGVGGSGSYRGHAGWLRAINDLSAMFDDFRVAPEEFRDGDDWVFAAVRLQGRGRGSGAAIDVPVVHVCTMRTGRVARFHAYTDRSKALEALGLSE